MPEKLIPGIDPNAAPFLMGMMIKIKNFTELKGIAILVTFLITISFSVGVFYTQTNAMINEGRVFREEFTKELNNIKIEISSVKKELALTNNNVGHIGDDIDKFTTQMGRMQSEIAKIRR